MSSLAVLYLVPSLAPRRRQSTSSFPTMASPFVSLLAIVQEPHFALTTASAPDISSRFLAALRSLADFSQLPSNVQGALTNLGIDGTKGDFYVNGQKLPNQKRGKSIKNHKFSPQLSFLFLGKTG